MTTLNERCQPNEICRTDARFATPPRPEPAVVQAMPRTAHRRAPAARPPADTNFDYTSYSLFESELMAAWAKE